MKYNLFDIGGEVVKQNDTLLIKENKSINNVVIQSIVLYTNKNTKKLCFHNQDCIYFFIDGKGVFELGNDILYVRNHDFVLVNRDISHRVINTGDINLRYLILKEFPVKQHVTKEKI